MRQFFYAVIMVGVLLGASLSFADDEAYIVRGVEVTLPAGNPVKLRERALRQATEEGYQTLLKKMTPSRVWSRHPWLMRALKAEDALERFAIVQEDVGTAYYLQADLTYSRDKVRKLLSGQGIPFSEADQTKVLIVPFYEAGSARVVWDAVNPWRDALAGALLREGGVVFTLPAGETLESATVTPDMVAARSRGALLELAERYEADAVVVAQAKQGSGKIDIQADWIRAEGKATPPSGQFSVFLPVGQEADYSVAAQRLVQSLEGAWQQSGLVAADKPGRVYLKVALPELVEVQHFLTQVQALSSVRTVMARVLSRQESVYRLDYFGDFTDIKAQLEAQNYTLARTGAMWRVEKQSF